MARKRSARQQSGLSLLREALDLSTDEREELAVEILASLDADALEDTELAWATEIEERARRVLAGESTGKPRPEVRDRIRREVLGR